MTKGSLLLITLYKGHSQSLTCCPSSGGCIAPASGVFHTRISSASSVCTTIISWVNTRLANSCSFYWEESIWRELTGLPSQPRKTSETNTRSAIISQARYSTYFFINPFDSDNCENILWIHYLFSKDTNLTKTQW